MREKLIQELKWLGEVSRRTLNPIGAFVQELKDRAPAGWRAYEAVLAHITQKDLIQQLDDFTKELVSFSEKNYCDVYKTYKKI